jgi:NAD(P)-dependent dehydrogenase (short-subunit alcohol dehydrogenase family)
MQLCLPDREAEQLPKLFQEAVDHYGRLDVVVNHAGHALVGAGCGYTSSAMRAATPAMKCTEARVNPIEHSAYTIFGPSAYLGSRPPPPAMDELI